ncbi:hypothetical protein CTAYLR_001993 [Chrysophaeum taylorii]|uniref:Aldose 1-epimerase n=1 Tax=Chrysophaeum taylorii TaxID=2483200 RepID=A0AAD7U8N0_9STRA|nr:hypothetical protein CTAYLR_001993 [Chrysophaeum taylorii]
MACCVGRCAGRIRNAAFSVGETRYELEPNSGRHLLHGGHRGWSFRDWEIVERETRRVSLRLAVDDDGFPGRAVAAVTYAVEGARLTMRFECTTDAPSPVSMTNHAYFNLGGDLEDHYLRVSGASRFVETDDDLVPTGHLKSCPEDLDFSAPKRLVGDLDHCLVVDDGAMIKAFLRGPRVSMRLATTQPGLQVYTANFLPGLHRRTAVCLETQHLPDSVNHPNFPSWNLVDADRPYDHATTIDFFGCSEEGGGDR